MYRVIERHLTIIKIGTFVQHLTLTVDHVDHVDHMDHVDHVDHLLPMI